MVNYKFNSPYYELQLTGIEKGSINVLSFEGEERISELFEYRIRFISADPALDSSKILNNAAAFTLNRGDEDPLKIHGIISEFEQYGRTPDYVFYRVVLVPQLWRTKLVYQNQVYQKLTVEELIKDVLAKNGVSGQNFRMELKNNYPESEFIVQYRETDYNFISRKCEHFGIYFYFDHSGDKDVVVFTDANTNLPSITASDPIGYNKNKDALGSKESILEIQCTEKVVTGAVQLKDYNYMFPEKQLMAQSQINSNHPGMFYDFGDNFANEKEAEYLAKVRNQEFLADSKKFTGSSDSRLLRTGYRMKINNHYRDDWNSEYIITSLTSRGTQQGLFAFLPQPSKFEPTYENKFEAIPFDIEFRPKRKTHIPKVKGVMSAKLETGASDAYAFLDDHGRYKVKMLYDISDATNGEASLPVRLTQSYSGEGYGIHFPNHAGTELLWACVDGNVDRPVGLGTVPNPSHAAPVVNNNKTQNVIRTASGNEFIMEDKEQETRIYLGSSDGHKLDMDDKDDKILMTSKNNHSLLLNDKDKFIRINTTNGHTLQLDDSGKMIEIKTVDQHYMRIDDGGKKIEVSDKEGKNRLIIDIGNNKIVVETADGNIDLLAPKGEIQLKAKTIKTISEGDTSMQAANIKAKADKDVKIDGSNVTVEAKSDLKEKGGNITSEASMEHKSKGMNLTIEAAVNTQVKGAMVTVQSSGPNTIKGMPVQIN
jgi:type VI secretion system secreted protein VgrG